MNENIIMFFLKQKENQNISIYMMAKKLKLSHELLYKLLTDLENKKKIKLHSNSVTVL